MSLDVDVVKYVNTYAADFHNCDYLREDICKY